MSALPVPQPSPANKKMDPVSRFKEEYALALIDVEVSAEHTSTEGWQKLYAGQRKLEREARRSIADDLRNVADRLEATPLDDDGIKEIGALKTACTNLNDLCTAFDVQTIKPVRDPVEKCQRIIDEAMSMARMEEERHPLVNTGLEELMKIAIDEVSRWRWEPDAGRVTAAR